jgi:hypothetical protein
MPVAGWIAVVVLTLMLVGAAAGRWVRAGKSYRQAPAVAWICTLVIGAIVLVVSDASTPQTACGGTGCDTANGIGTMFAAVAVFPLVLVGVAIGRVLARRRGDR